MNMLQIRFADVVDGFNFLINLLHSQIDFLRKNSFFILFVFGRLHAYNHILIQKEQQTTNFEHLIVPISNY